MGENLEAFHEDQGAPMKEDWTMLSPSSPLAALLTSSMYLLPPSNTINPTRTSSSSRAHPKGDIFGVPQH